MSNKLQFEELQNLGCSTNVNGIKLEKENKTKHFQTILQHMHECKVDIFGLAETNLEWRNYKINSMLYKTFQKHFPGGKGSPTTSKIIMTQHQKPGGALIGMNKSITSQWNHTIKDTTEDGPDSQ